MNDIKTHLFRIELEASFDRLLCLKYYLEEFALDRELELCNSMLDKLMALSDSYRDC